MSPSQWLISGFILFHLLAIIVGSTPAPGALPPPQPPDRAVLPAIGRALAPVLDATVGPVLTVNTLVWRATRWFHGPVRVYLRTTRQYQLWNMFSRPARRHRYIHLRYYVASKGSRLLQVHRQLIYPAEASGDIRLFKSYSGSFQDKAVGLVLERYFRKFENERKRHGVPESLERAQDSLFPLMRPFALRRAAQTMATGERLVRAEFWQGYAPMGRPGDTIPEELLRGRREALQEYDAVTDLRLISSEELPPLGAVAYDVDIEWTLRARIIWK